MHPSFEWAEVLLDEWVQLAARPVGELDEALWGGRSSEEDRQALLEAAGPRARAEALFELIGEPAGRPR